MLSSLAAVVILIAMLIRNDAPTAPSTPSDDGVEGGAEASVMLYCAASNRAVMEAVRADYEAETGRHLEIQYGPSQTLLSSIEVSGTGDLFLPADDSYLKMAREKRLVREMLPLARMQGVVAVKKGNPKAIHSFSDLLRQDVRLVQASPDTAAIGRKTREVLQPQKLWNKLQQSTAGYRTTVNEVATDVVVGAVDAAIVYDAVLHTYEQLEFVELPELGAANSEVAIGVLAGSRQPQKALHFARYLAATDRGLRRYQEYGFRTGQGDLWADVPELSVFAGSMLRPAIDDTITAFEQREGVRVTRVYNGCGILVSQMAIGEPPDAYFACDTEFMQKVHDLFPESTDVSRNELVILVQKGNPHQIASLRDLTRSGIRVGIGHEKQCAMGWLTQKTLKEGGLQEEVMNNVTTQLPTGDMLVNELLTGALDAAVVYLSNAAGSADSLDAVLIQDLPCSVATQPFAIARQSHYRQLAGRLFEQICSAESRQAFRRQGFRWQADELSRDVVGPE